MHKLLSLLLLGVLTPALSAQAFFDVPSTYPTIQAAIDAATTGGVVRIAPGTYSGPGNVDLDPRGKAITIRGDSAQTTVIDCQGSVATPHRAFRILAGGTALVIELLRIENGYEAEGGAIEIRNAQPTIRGASFASCTATQRGGAIFLDGIAPVSLADCRFESCDATDGGALFSRSVLPARMDSCSLVSNSATSRGGAIYVDGFTVAAVGCRFETNSSALGGGAIFASGGSVVRLDSCDFDANHSDGAGGALSLDGTGTMGELSVCQFSGNRAGHPFPAPGNAAGGAIWVGDATALTCRDGRFDDNHAQALGGAIGIAQHTLVQLERCRLERNVADSHGGGLGADGTAIALQMVDCEILASQSRFNVGGNLFVRAGVSLSMQGGRIGQALSGGAWIQGASARFQSVAWDQNNGAAFTAEASAVEFDACEFLGNRAPSNAVGEIRGGSAVVLRGCTLRGNQAWSGDTGALLVDPGSTLELERSKILGNWAAGSHGAIRVFGGAAILRGCLLAGNAAVGEVSALGVIGSGSTAELDSCTIVDNSSNGAALRCEQGTLVLENSIVWGNFRSGLQAVSGGVITATYCDVQGGFPGLGNLSVSPSFANAAAGDYRLSALSPLRDAGSNALVPATLVVDLDGSPRLVGLAVDIGADEYLAPLPGTLDPLRLVTRVNGAGAELTTKSAPAGSTLALHFEALATPLQSAVGLVLGNVVPASTPIVPTPGLPGLQLDLALAIYFVGGTAPPPFGLEYLGTNGITRAYLVPPGLAGARLRLQGVALGPMTQSGFLAFTDGQELFF